MKLDRAAIERLYRSHGQIVLRRARTILGNESDAQEALQEVFASLLRSPESLRKAASVVGWLYKATTHYCLNLLRNRRTGLRLRTSRASTERTPSGSNRAIMCSSISLLPRNQNSIGRVQSRSRNILMQTHAFVKYRAPPPQITMPRP